MTALPLALQLALHHDLRGVTCDSSMTSSNADWVLGLARLTSSARTTWANTGPAWKIQSPVFWS